MGYLRLPSVVAVFLGFSLPCNKVLSSGYPGLSDLPVIFPASSQFDWLRRSGFFAETHRELEEVTAQLLSAKKKGCSISLTSATKKLATAINRDASGGDCFMEPGVYLFDQPIVLKNTALNVYPKIPYDGTVMSDIALAHQGGSDPALVTAGDRVCLNNIGVVQLIPGIISFPKSDSEKSSSSTDKTSSDKGGSNSITSSSSNGGSISNGGSNTSSGAGSGPPDDPKSFQKLLKQDGLEQRDLLIIILRHLLGYITHIEAGDIDQFVHRIDRVSSALASVGGGGCIKKFDEMVQSLVAAEIGNPPLESTVSLFLLKYRGPFVDLESNRLARLRNILVESLVYYINLIDEPRCAFKMASWMQEDQDLASVAERSEVEYRANQQAVKKVQNATVGRRRSRATIARRQTLTGSAFLSVGRIRPARSSRGSNDSPLRSKLFQQLDKQWNSQGNDSPTSAPKERLNDLDTISVSSVESTGSVCSSSSLGSSDSFSLFRMLGGLEDQIFTISRAGSYELFLYQLFKLYVGKGKSDELLDNHDGSAIFMLLADSLAEGQLDEFACTLGVDRLMNNLVSQDSVHESLRIGTRLVHLYKVYTRKKRGTRERFIKKLSKVMGADFEQTVARIESEYLDLDGLQMHSYQARVQKIQCDLQDEEERRLQRRLSTPSGALCVLLTQLYNRQGDSPFDDSVLEVISGFMNESSLAGLSEAVGLRVMTVDAGVLQVTAPILRRVVNHFFGIGVELNLDSADSSELTPLENFVTKLIEAIGVEASNRLIDTLPDPKNLRDVRRKSGKRT